MRNQLKFQKNIIILNKQLIPNKRSKQHQTKMLPHKTKKIMSYNSTQHHNHPEKAEWLAQKNGIKIQKNRKKWPNWEPRKEQSLKKLIKNPNPKQWSLCFPSEQKILDQHLNKHHTTTFRHSQDFPPKGSKVSSEMTNWNPSTFRH